MEALCKSCGKVGTCACHGDMGTPSEYHIKFTFECACGHSEQQVVNGGSTSYENWFTICPFCSTKEETHNFHKEV